MTGLVPTLVILKELVLNITVHKMELRYQPVEVRNLEMIY